MRLTRTQQRLIVRTVAHVLGSGARVWLFGSRLRDEARGGDLDLLIEGEDQPTLMQRARIKLALESALSMPVDIVAIRRGAAPTAFQRIALATGVQIGEV